MTSTPHGSRRRGRQLDAEERRLWKEVARSVKPLRGTEGEAPADDDAPPSPVPMVARAEHPPVSPPRASPRSSSPPALSPLPRRERQRLARGVAAIDARIDLHGLTQAQAHAALTRFLRRAQADGARFALVITGKGARFAAGDGGRGLLKRQVPMWLRLPEFRTLVVGFETAHAAHGGEGALYVRLRRPRD